MPARGAAKCGPQLLAPHGQQDEHALARAGEPGKTSTVFARILKPQAEHKFHTFSGEKAAEMQVDAGGKYSI